MSHNWGMISDGATFESLAQSLLFFERPGTILFGRPGPDSGQDARSADGAVVYQAKFHRVSSMDDAISDALAELDKIKEYRKGEHKNYTHWKNAKSWILIGNFSVNPNDHQKWVAGVVPHFSAAGLSAEYWSREKLDAMLAGHPDVADNFFSGRNRNFLSLNEAYRSVISENFGELMYSIKELGRDSTICDMRKFLEDNQCNIIPVIGFGGVGKTRFIYERGVEYCNEGWRVFWANTETMTDSSDWFRGISAEDQVLVLANEPQSAKFVQKCLEQLGSHPRNNWKVIVAVRSSRDPVINFIHAAATTGARVSADIELAPLSTDSSKELLRSILSTVGVELNEAHLEKLASSCEGYPVWIGLAAQLLRESGNTRDFPNSSRGLVDRYLQEVETDHTPLLCEVRHLRSVLQWVALFKVCNVEDSALLKFLEGQIGLASEKIVALLHNLVERRVLRNWGVNKRLYAIKPDVIRDHILRKWLVDETSGSARPSVGSKNLVKLLLGKDNAPSIPHADTVLTEIARTEYMNLGGGVRILAPFFEELQKEASSSSVLTQKGVVRLVSKTGFSSPEDAIDTLATIVNTATDPETIADDLWGSFEVTHKSVVDDIPSALRQLASYIESRDEASKLFGLLKKIYLNRYAPKGTFSYERVPEEDIIQQLINQYRTPPVLTSVVTSCCDEYVEKLKSNVPLSDAELAFAKLVLNTFLDVERESTDWAGMAVYLQRHVITLGSPLGKEMTKIRNSLKDVINTTLLIPNKTLAWDIISSTNSAMNRAVGVKADLKAMMLWQQEMYAEYAADLTWCLGVLNAQKDSMSIAEWSAARELWEWDIKFSENEKTKKIAEQCEALYKAAPLISEFRLGELFDWSKYKEEAAICDEIANDLISKGQGALVRFIAAAGRYVAAKERASATKAYGIARALGQKIDEAPFITAFIDDVLSQKEHDELSFDFAMEAIRAELLVLRKEAPDQVIENLKRYASLADDKLLFASRYYWNQHPLNIGIPTHDDVEFIKSLGLVFDANQRYEKFFGLAGVLFFWDSKYFTDLLKSCWEGLGSDDNKKSIAMRVFINSLWLTWLRYKDDVHLAVPDDMMVTITDIAVELPDAGIMFSHELLSLCEETHQKLSLQQFNDILRKRIALPGGKDVSSNSSFRRMPFDFKVTPWVAFNPASDKQQFYELIELSQAPAYVAHQDIPEYAIELDPDGAFVPSYIGSKLAMLLEHPPTSAREITRWTYFAGFYDNESAAWLTIARPACKLASTMTKKERIRIFCSLNPISTGVRSIPVGGVDPYYLQGLDKAVAALENEKDPDLLSYRKWMVDVATSELEYAKGRAEEDFRHE